MIDHKRFTTEHLQFILERQLQLMFRLYKSRKWSGLFNYEVFKGLPRRNFPSSETCAIYRITFSQFWGSRDYLRGNLVFSQISES